MEAKLNNPNFIAYASSKGLTPEKCLLEDALQYPGGKMAGFILWMGDRFHEFDSMEGRIFGSGELWIRDDEKFSTWLQKQYVD